jgi:hypothetical protein
VAGLFVVPKVEELVADPGQIGVLDIDTARVLKTQAIAALNLLHGYDLERARTLVDGHGLQRRDRLLNVAEAAVKLGVKPDWLYIAITKVCPSQCGMAGYCASPNWGLRITSADGSVERSETVPSTRRRKTH